MITATTLRAARAGLDWSQADLATAAGIHPKSVAYHERAGRPRRPTENTPAIPKSLI